MQWRKTFAEFYMSVGAKASGKLFDPTKYYNYWNPIHKTEKKLCGLNLIELNSVMLYL